MRTWRRHHVAIIGLPIVIMLGVVAIVAALGAGSARAQDDGAALHPAHIHGGTCDDLGDVVAPLSDVGSGAMADGTPVAAAEPSGPDSAIPVLVSMTTVDLPLADIVGGGHAINIHESAENIGNYIACGDIGGAMMGNTLAIGLGQLNDSGAAGVALLEDTGDQTMVNVYLTKSGTIGASASASAAASDESAAVNEVAVDIVNFTYDPDPVEITAGDTITWTNQDVEPHTATTRDRDLLQTGTLRGGQTASQTFDTPGNYEYFCEFHANMSGSIVVS